MIDGIKSNARVANILWKRKDELGASVLLSLPKDIWYLIAILIVNNKYNEESKIFSESAKSQMFTLFFNKTPTTEQALNEENKMLLNLKNTSSKMSY